MNFGFNSNVRVGGALYHVQTEDRGPAHPFLDTVVYQAGRVVHKRSTSYEDLAQAIAAGKVLPQQLHERLAHQHREVIAQLEAGGLVLNESGNTMTRNDEQTARENLQIHLLNPTSWLAAGNVTLQIEVKREGSARAIAGTQVEAFLEGEKDRSPQFRGLVDAQGHATLQFPLPPTVAGGTALVIRATDGDVYSELRFRLQARRRVPSTAPAPAPAKQ